MLILVSLYWMAVFFARMVMPRSRSRSPESMTRSTVSWFSRYTPPCFSISSTRVVLPWSTWAMMATFLRCSFCILERPFLYQLSLTEIHIQFGIIVRFSPYFNGKIHIFSKIAVFFSGKSNSRQGRTFFTKETSFFAGGFVPSAVDSPNAGGL